MSHINEEDIKKYGVRELDRSGTQKRKERTWCPNKTHLCFGYIGAASLAIPVVIMVWRFSPLTCLYVSVGFTFLIGLILACLAGKTLTTLEDKDILTIVPAYAAVLIVFIGNSLTNTNS